MWPLATYLTSLYPQLLLYKVRIIILPVAQVHWHSRQNYSDTCSNSKKTLFRSVAVVVKTVAIGRDIGLNAEYSRQLGSITKELGEGINGWKSAKRRHQG